MRISPAATEAIEAVYTGRMSVAQLVAASEREEWQVHAFLATRRFQEEAVSIYGGGFTGAETARFMHTSLGRVYYHLRRVAHRRGFTRIRELRD